MNHQEKQQQEVAQKGSLEQDQELVKKHKLDQQLLKYQEDLLRLLTSRLLRVAEELEEQVYSQLHFHYFGRFHYFGHFHSNYSGGVWRRKKLNSTWSLSRRSTHWWEQLNHWDSMENQKQKCVAEEEPKEAVVATVIEIAAAEEGYYVEFDWEQSLKKNSKFRKHLSLNSSQGWKEYEKNDDEYSDLEEDWLEDEEGLKTEKTETELAPQVEIGQLVKYVGVALKT